MWKWILGAVALVLLLIGGGMWYGFRKMSQFANGDSTSTLTIGAAPDRVFASLADGDSIVDWMVGGRVRPSRSGPLRKGDTLYVQQRDSVRARPMNWIVREVVPGKALTLQLEADTLNFIAVSRRYTVVGMGDSTLVYSTVTSPMMDSVNTKAKSRNANMLEFTSKMMIGVMRMQNQMELKQLKARIEGTQTAVPVAPRP